MGGHVRTMRTCALSLLILVAFAASDQTPHDRIRDAALKKASMSDDVIHEHRDRAPAGLSADDRAYLESQDDATPEQEFMEMDTNKDGKASFDEVKAFVIKKCHDGKTSEEAEEDAADTFKEMDTDKNGHITQQEMVDAANPDAEDDEIEDEKEPAKDEDGNEIDEEIEDID